MSKLKLDIEWIEPESAKGEELSATWAALRISVNEIPITRISTFNGERERVFLPLYPLAEWLVLNWWFINGEVQAEHRISVGNYQTRHNIRFAREGFSLPNLILQPLGEHRMELRWWPERLHFQKLEFLEEGIAELNKAEVADELKAFIETVIEKLEYAGISETVLQQEWETIRTTEPEEEDFCLISASLGVDPYALDDKNEQLIINTYGSLPKNITADFFSVANFKKLKKESEELRQSIELLKAVETVNETIKGIKKKIIQRTANTAKPWEQGYKAALVLRKELNLNGQPVGDIEQIGHSLGYTLNNFNKAVIRKSNKLLPVAGIVNANKKGSPVFYINERNIPSIDKFTFCRSLFDFLASDTEQTHLVTGAKNENQKRNRAFAAEFLAPHHSIGKKIQGNWVSADEVEELAHHFNVSTFVIKHQIENHHLATLDEG